MRAGTRQPWKPPLLAPTGDASSCANVFGARWAGAIVRLATSMSVGDWTGTPGAAIRRPAGGLDQATAWPGWRSVAALPGVILVRERAGHCTTLSTMKIRRLR